MLRKWVRPELSIPAAGQRDRGSGDENATTHPISTRPSPPLMYVTSLPNPALLFQVLLPSLKAWTGKGATLTH